MTAPSALIPAIPLARLPKPDPNAPDWLVRDLWASRAVGCLGAAPKTGKTWLTLEMAVAVASGTRALGHLEVPRPGRVLVHCAQDGPDDIRHRVAGLCSARNLDFDKLDLCWLDAPNIALDDLGWQTRLLRTVQHNRPVLVVLDPFVRMFHGDENSAADVSRTLSFLRALQRDHGTAVLLVHHVRKGGDVGGAALRGSGDLHAWGDSNLYLHRRDDGIHLVAEHRARPAPEPVVLRLEGDPPRLNVVGTAPERSLDERVLDALDQPTGHTRLRERIGVRNETLGEVLVRLHAAGRLRREGSLIVRVPVPA